MWVVAPDAKRLKIIQKALGERLGSAEASKVEFYTPADLVDVIEALELPAWEETVIKGYRVKSTRKVTSPEDAERRRQQITNILSKKK